jgi:alpha-tubulin suppressor-like RCC1 family protein
MNAPLCQCLVARSLRHYAALLATAVVLAACGGGGADPAAAPAQSQESAQLQAHEQTKAQALTPAPVPTVDIYGRARVVANTRYSYRAVSSSGTPSVADWSWGDGAANSSGVNVQKLWRKPGSFTNSVQAVVNSQAVSASQTVTAIGAPVSPGNSHSCALRPNGNVLCWGGNSVGQLGNGNTVSSNTPLLVFGVLDAVALTAGKGHTCALRASGGVLCWGGNYFGQLGNGSNVYISTTPVAVRGISDAIAVAAGEDHTCALKAGGSVVCWGYNYHGQLGNGSTVSSHLIVPVTGVSKAVALAAGGGHTCVVLASAGLRCWGSNYRGQLGNGGTVDSTTPVDVTDVGDAVALAAGYIHNCAVQSSGSVKCWGDNSGGELGNGHATFTAVVSPLTVIDMKDAVALAAGEGFTCALRSDNSVSCWGINTRGELGDGFAEPHSASPVKVTGLSGVVALGAAFEHACALLQSGDLRCWGWNIAGQLGDGTQFDRGLPTPVIGGALFWQ